MTGLGRESNGKSGLPLVHQAGRVQEENQELIVRGASNDWAIKASAVNAVVVIALEQFGADGLLAAHGTAERALGQLLPHY